MKTSLFFVLLLSPLFFAIGNIIDSYLVTKYGGDEDDHGNIAGLLVIGSFFSLFAVIASLVFGFSEIKLFELKPVVLLIFSGILSAASICACLYALQEDNPTAVTVWWQTIPFFSYVLAYFFLGENIQFLQIVGGVVVVAGSLIVGMSEFKEVKLSTIFNKKVVPLMLVASICYSIVAVIFKSQALYENSYWGSSFYENIGILLVGVAIYLFYKKSRDTFHQFITVKEIPLLVMNSMNELLFIGATFITQFVTLDIPIVIGSVMNGLTPAFVFIISIIFAKFFPGKINDIDLSRNTILKNIFGILLTLIGLIFIR